MKKIKRFLTGGLVLALALVASATQAQFAPGQVLTAAQLNSAFANVLPLAGGTLTGPLTVPTLNTVNAQITGGTISGLATPLPFGSGGTGANSQGAALAALLGTSAIPIANGGTNATTALAATSNLQWQSAGSGAVVQSIAAKLGQTINAADFGAVCNNSNDDTASINAALTRAGNVAPAIVRLPLTGQPCRYSATLNVPANVTLQGAPGNSVGLSPLAQNLSAISLNGNYSSVRDLYIFAGAMGTNTAGTIIGTSTNTGQLIDNVYINGPVFRGIDVNGLQTRVNGSYVNFACGAGAAAIRVGNLTTNGGTVDPHISGTITTSCQSPSTPADAGTLVLDAGGLFIDSSDNLFAKVGTKIFPGLNQSVTWSSLSNTYVGDTSSQYALMVDTADATAKIWGTQCTGCWVSNSGSTNVLVQNTAGGSIAGLHFLGMRNYSTSGNGMSLNAGANVTIDASHFCGIGAGAADIYVNAAIPSLAIRNSELGSTCNIPQFTSTPAYGILFGVATTNTIIAGNDFTGPTTAVGALPLNAVVSGNVGLNSQVQSLFVVNDLSTSAQMGAQIYAPNNTNGAALKLVGNGTNPSKTIRSNGGNFQIVNSAFSAIIMGLSDAGNLTTTGSMAPSAGIVLPRTTVGALPTCNSGAQGLTYMVTDASSPTYNSALTGGSSTVTLASCNGSAWTAH